MSFREDYIRTAYRMILGRWPEPAELEEVRAEDVDELRTALIESDEFDSAFPRHPRKWSPLAVRLADDVYACGLLADVEFTRWLERGAPHPLAGLALCLPERERLGVLDVGANGGGFASAILAARPEMEIATYDCVEPSRAYHDCLRMLADLTPRLRGLSLHLAFASDRDEELRLAYADPRHRPGDIAVQGPSGNTDDHPPPKALRWQAAEPLDQRLMGSRYDVIRISAGGNELKALAGLSRIVEACRPVVMLATARSGQADPEDAARQEAALLNRLRYRRGPHIAGHAILQPD